jgi:hypothetical protein
VASVVVGQQSHQVEQVGAVGAVEARLVGASDHTRLLAIDADEIFGAIAKVAADQIVARPVVLARVRLALVDVLVTPERHKMKNEKSIADFVKRK